MIHHAVDHAADFTLSNSPQVTHSVHSLCQHILFPLFLSQLFLSHCLDGLSPRHFIGSMIMSSWPATPSTINDRLPSCVTPSIVSQTFKATLTVSLFMLYVTVKNQRLRDFISWLLHSTLRSKQPNSFPSSSSIPQFDLVHSLSQPQPFHHDMIGFLAPSRCAIRLSTASQRAASVFVCSLSLRQM